MLWSCTRSVPLRLSNWPKCIIYSNSPTWIFINIAFLDGQHHPMLCFSITNENVGFRTWAAVLHHTCTHTSSLSPRNLKSADYCVSLPFVFLLVVKVWSRSASLKLPQDLSSMLSFRVRADYPVQIFFEFSFVSAMLFTLTSEKYSTNNKGVKPWS